MACGGIDLSPGGICETQRALTYDLHRLHTKGEPLPKYSTQGQSETQTFGIYYLTSEQKRYIGHIKLNTHYKILSPALMVYAVQVIDTKHDFVLLTTTEYLTDDLKDKINMNLCLMKAFQVAFADTNMLNILEGYDSITPLIPPSG